VRERRRWSTETFEVLLMKARDGDEDAWRELASRLSNVAWRVINTFELPPADADDALAATFFRLADNLHQVRDPERLPGWVATTAKHEVYALFRSRRNIDLNADVPRVAVAVEHDREVIVDELRLAMRQAFAKLSKDCQDLLRLFTTDPPLSYDEIGTILDRKHGSIGPKRRRCLDRLRDMDELKAFVEGRGV
jgi:RNA polymerase sigma factor (sigma-70 family)